MAKEKQLFNVEVGSKGVFTRHSRQTNFDTLAEAKTYAREQLAKGNAVAVSKTDRWGEFQTIAQLGEKNPPKFAKPFSNIGKLKPLSLKQQMKSKGKWQQAVMGGDVGLDIKKETGVWN